MAGSSQAVEIREEMGRPVRGLQSEWGELRIAI